ncbi:SurA N-terminal domain-containing protein [Sphingomonas donggukensis]|uniref:Parvulin-like PPIase n=1 Tax=Sphingomonas donggukensis TaxID=2949093 RepID=A0ABY4TVP1_9SPHN|nr:peptidylprolyl isomerase [Sphingomonas donggukensis]URW76372.1 SurA N-terminal domain-containing protein [Sphingomonas donggukensis]
MLNSFRRAINSTVGKIVALGVLVVIALAFAAGDITNLRGNNAGSLGGAVAEVGETKIGEAELRQRTQTAYSAYQQQQPGLDMASFVTQGGMTAVLERTINGIALQKFAESIGMSASKRAVDGEIAGIPGFAGVDGKFSQANYDAALRQQGLTDAGLRADIARDMLSRQLLAPTAGARQVSSQLAMPYASLLLERRQGAIGVIPVTALGVGTPPTDAELQTFYTRNRGRYMVPERRAVRYALVKAADVAAGAKATTADIAAAYNANKARFAPSEKRNLTQVVVASQQAATALAAKVKGGSSLSDAARAIGLEASTATGVDKAAFTAQSATAVADAAFAATAGTIVGPVRSPLGWHVVKVDQVTPIAGKTLAQATPELTTEIEKTKAAQAIADVHDRLDSAAAENATFDELVSDAKLVAQTTAPLVASGMDPDAPAKPDPIVARLAQAAFIAEDGDAPQLVQTDADGSFAVVAVGRVVPAAPRPLAQIRATVARDFVIDRNLKAARALAVAAVNKVNAGTPLSAALAQTSLKLPPVETKSLSRAELAAGGTQVPPPLALMFSMAAKKAKLLEAPNRGGWYIVYLDAIQNGDASKRPEVIASTRQGLGGVVGRELSEQFAAAVRKQVGVQRNDAAVAKVRAELAPTSAN